MFAGGDPLALAGAAGGLRRTGADLGDLVSALSGASHGAAAAAGDADLAAAVDRFAAAWGGELLACALATGTLARFGEVVSEQVHRATGGR